MRMQRLDRRQARQMPWKNGGGTTCELAIAPEGAGLEDFAWRISCARVASSGPFSHFAGIERSLVLLDGQGLDLRLNGLPRTLRPGDPPLLFAGEDQVSAELLDGPISDLNLMTRRSAWRHELQTLQLDRTQALPHAADILLIYCQAGPVVVQLPGATAYNLDEGQGLLLKDSPAEPMLSTATSALLYIGRLYRQP